MPYISATEAARRFSDVLDTVEHGKERYTIIRRGKAVARLLPIAKGRGAEVKEVIRSYKPDAMWSKELSRLGELVEIDPPILRIALLDTTFLIAEHETGISTP